jgi:hypothetical protein
MYTSSGGKPALADAVDDAPAKLRGGGEALGLHELPARLVEPDQIGEGAADIDRNNNHASKLPGLSARCAPSGHDMQIVRDCRIAPTIGRQRKISDTSQKGKDLKETGECGHG